MVLEPKSAKTLIMDSTCVTLKENQHITLFGIYWITGMISILVSVCEANFPNKTSKHRDSYFYLNTKYIWQKL